jgi:hypothetical protein
MFNTIITTYILSQLNCTAIEYGRMDWAWNDGSGTNLTMDLDKPNSVDGILLFNFGISTTGAGGPNITVSDTKLTSHVIYTINNDVKLSLLSPFMYFTKGNILKLASSVACVYGVNYITVQKK